MRRFPLLLAASVAGAGVIAAALVGSAGAGRTPRIAPPASIAKLGKIVYCSDITYPPEEFYRGSTPAGSDVDIGTAVAGLMGVKAEFKNTTFSSIIAALLAKKCDAIISGMNDTAQRRKVVDFVDYLSVGQSLMVKKGNPEHIARLSDLAGKSVAVEAGTTNRQFLAATSANLVKKGQKAITIKTFPKDTDAAAALKTGKVDAYFGDSPVVAYYIARDHSFAFGGQPINPIPVGIAIRKHDPLRAGVQKAINTMYANGTIKRILTARKMAAFELKK
jgi:polar amino acid transport system substrate-binding protein